MYHTLVIYRIMRLLSLQSEISMADIGGRPLRIDLAGSSTVRDELMDGGVPGLSEPRLRGGFS